MWEILNLSHTLNPHIGGLKFCNYDVVKRKIDSKLGGDMDDVKTTSGDEDGRQALPFTKFPHFKISQLSEP